jgi:glycosyltransferase involved in cell wall biosynthesis
LKPLVSILIPAYNSEEWIADTLRSAIAQTWDRKEIIVVDDGSRDQTLAVARQFESDSVRVFTQENQGASAARNKAFSLCQGDYIQWLDNDDLLAPDKIERQIQALSFWKSKRTLFSSRWGSFMFRPRRAKFVPTALWCDLSPTEFLLRKMGQDLFMQTSVWLVSRELSESAGPWNTTMLTDDDGEYFCRVLLACDGIRFVPEARTYWRSSGTTQASYMGRSEKKLEAQWRSIQLHIGCVRSLEDSERVRAACVRYIQNWMGFFYPERLDIFRQAEEMSRNLGGKLVPPRLSWKYSWIKAIFGWRLARHAQLSLPSFRWSVVRLWDKALFRLEGRKQAASLAI